jgi:hypothetical protein
MDVGVARAPILEFEQRRGAYLPLRRLEPAQEGRAFPMAGTCAGSPF